ncbi:hypothetical protein [Tenacibaculum phage JQ]|nr:hypothetical protein [Tenacibaculum phage JQ]
MIGRYQKEEINAKKLLIESKIKCLEKLKSNTQAEINELKGKLEYFNIISDNQLDLFD